MSETRLEKRYYPLCLDVQGRKCAVVGGGNVALRKVSTLLEYGADVTVISPRLCADLRKLADAEKVRVIPRSYESGDLAGAMVAIVATSSRRINAMAAAEAQSMGILVNVVDDPGLSGFIVPSVLRRGSLAISISTGGMSPALARKIRTRLQQEFGPEYSRLLLLVNSVRTELKKHGRRVGSKAWQDALDLDELAGLIRQGRAKDACQVLLSRLTASAGKRK
jgi:siroheme synthase-like protein